MVIENSELMMLLRPIKWVCPTHNFWVCPTYNFWVCPTHNPWVCPTLLRVPGRALYYCGAHPVGLGVSIRYNYLYKRYI